MAHKSSFSLRLSDFKPLGTFAEAGLQATEFALQLAKARLQKGRIPIAGSLIERRKNGSLKIAALGANGRIPDDKAATGYPTDHGETSAIRSMHDFAKVNWAESVFATTLSPCIMCGRSIQALHERGLHRVVVAESSSFSGTIDFLRSLPGMQVIALSNKRAIEMMTAFAKKYPWDWAADIGEIPPARIAEPLSPESLRRILRKSPMKGARDTALIINPDGEVLSAACDERDHFEGNPCRSAGIAAIGEAGSAVNIRECGMVYASSDRKPVTIERFGHASLGACELFRPAWIAFTAKPEAELVSALQKKSIRCVY